MAFCRVVVSDEKRLHFGHNGKVRVDEYGLGIRSDKIRSYLYHIIDNISIRILSYLLGTEGRVRIRRRWSLVKSTRFSWV